MSRLGVLIDIGSAVNPGGVWSLSEVESIYVEQVSAAVDLSGKVHIAYTDNQNRLRYAHNVLGEWGIADIETSGSPQHPSLTLDAAGAAHVSYFSSAFGELRYAKNTAGPWQVIVIGDVGSVHPYFGSDTAIALDHHGMVHIAYFDNRTGDLKRSTNRP